MALLGIAIQDTWNFFNEIYADLQKHYDVSVFKRKTRNIPFLKDRVNHYMFRHDLSKFLEKNDVVFFEWASELLVEATHLPKVCGVVTRLHRYEMYRWVDMVNWDAVDKIIVVSQAKRTEFIERFPKQENKVMVINESISLEKFSPQPRIFNGDIGILCNLMPRKRVYDLILTFYELSKRMNDLHLHIGGGMRSAYQDYYYSLHHLVKDLNLQDCVTFYGPVTNPRDWYHNIDIFISNSYSEGLQVAPMEAMASGCYCLAHHWHGADELMPKEYLYYTSNELQKLIEQYCKLTEEERNIHKQNMRSIAEKNFDINTTIGKINQTINEVAVSVQDGYRRR
jgi:glycosyltransferase involved in cell wall biosynthesis